MMDFEKAMQNVGDFGPYQLRFFLSLFFYQFYHGMQTAVTNFISAHHEHWCKIDILQNYTSEEQKDIAIPYTTNDNVDWEYDACYMYDIAFENYTSQDFKNWNRTLMSESNQVVSCSDWVFDYSEYQSTLSSKWDTVCDEDWWRLMMSTFYVCGLLLASLTCGRVIDRLGRRFSIIIYASIGAIVNIIAGFQPDLMAFTILRIIIGMSTRACGISASVMMSENMTSRRRSWHGAGGQTIYALGIAAISGFAFLLRDFQHLHILMGCLQATSLLMFFYVPESPRWLLSKGHLKKVKTILHTIAKCNGKVSPLEPYNAPAKEQQQISEDAIKKDVKTDVRKDGFYDLFRTPNLRRSTLIFHFMWVAINFTYLALTTTMDELTGSTYLNVLLSGLLEVPACVAAYFIMQYLGRKPGVMGLLFVSGILSLLTVPFDLISGMKTGATVLTILARAALSGSQVCLRTMTQEIFPTSLRASALGSCSSLAAALGIAGPYIGSGLRNVWHPLPSLIFGTLGVVGSFLMIWVPETLGEKLPDTTQEAEQLAHHRKTTAPKDMVVQNDMAAPNDSEALSYDGNGKIQSGAVKQSVMTHQQTPQIGPSLEYTLTTINI